MWSVDDKSGWLQAKVSQEHSVFFVFEFEGRLFVFTVFSFGDACASDGYTYLTHTFPDSTVGARIPHLRYINDTLGHGSPNIQVANLQFDFEFLILTNLGAVLGLKKSAKTGQETCGIRGGQRQWTSLAVFIQNTIHCGSG